MIIGVSRLPPTQDSSNFKKRKESVFIILLSETRCLPEMKVRNQSIYVDYTDRVE